MEEKDMRNATLVVTLAVLAGCASKPTAEFYKWTADCPSSVDKGSEFKLTVLATLSVEPAEEGGPTTQAVEGVEYTYQIHWTGGSSSPLRHRGWTGEPVKIRARLVPGPATILVTSLNKEGLDVKVLEKTIEVK
jgi:hypothetical protein